MPMAAGLLLMCGSQKHGLKSSLSMHLRREGDAVRRGNNLKY
jgi:hypothetical protein